MSSYWSTKSRPHYRSASAGHRAAPVSNPTPQTPPPPFGALLQTLKIEDLAVSSKKFVNSATIEDVEVITSYNWLDKKGAEPTILIPGKPPRWTPPLTSPQLSQDDGNYFRDKNAARYPKHPIEPGVVACLDADPALPSKVDIMACSSTLGNLLRFVRGSGEDKPFRMLVEKVGNTIFFIRRENSPTELIPDVRGYGHTFPEAYTTWEADVKGSCSHQRLLRYSFGGLNCVVRFGADGYISPAGWSAPHSASTANEKKPSVDDLINTLSGISVPSPDIEPSKGTLKVEKAGTAVDQRDVFDLKTRSIWTKLKKDHLADELPRLWVAQIPYFILAFHQSGFFAPNEIQIKNVRKKVKVWEKNQATHLASLAALIHRIIDVVSAKPSRKIELRCCETGKLEVRERLADAGEILSPGVRSRWEGEWEKGALSEKGDPDSEDEPYWDDRDDQLSWDEGSEKDFTACSADDCGYCGHCPY
ncbi:geranylgeranyl pyrophosphate synthetase [Cercophora newfieldiana]|uniref:Geranylgeranyl pyrophosphate synthetase n=1 Tax=Cercophora newfieldiana TaxID=92897 RepID=A0AA40CLR1_9PEZI|nr:geranylgeranyl pyrophosphate synthetase [Cercophora newfieldiana]